MYAKTYSYTHTHTHTHTRSCVEKQTVRLPVTQTVKALISAICRVSLEWKHPAIPRNWQTDQHLETRMGCVTSPSAEHTNALSHEQTKARAQPQRTQPSPPTETC